jgi:phosphoribosylamine--glycine ligase
MKILIVGNGGREHALGWKLRQSNPDVQLFSCGTNAGILSLATKVPVNEKNYDELAKFCLDSGIDMVVVGPEEPLSRGIADSLRAKGICVFGPSQLAARIESSKAFAKNFMKRHNIPTAQFRTFTYEEEKEAIDYINSLPTPIVLKADGLAAGKGVVVCESRAQAIETLKMFFTGLFGIAGSTVVVEEFLEGEEASVLALTDGERYVIFPPAQDHKRIGDGDRGKNTGGMGAYSPTPLVDSETLAYIEKAIIVPAIEGMATEGFPFNGCLYAGLMIQDKKAKVVEFNCRFGDPETQAVLPLVRGDFANLLYSIAKGSLESRYFEGVSSDQYSCCVILASNGYPDSYEKGFEITGIRKAESLGCLVFHSGTKLDGDKVITDGGRVVGVCGIGNTLSESIEKAYLGVEVVSFANKYYRRDIGKRGLRYV